MRTYTPKNNPTPPTVGLVNPHTASTDSAAQAATSGKPRSPSSRADNTPQPMRPGAQAALGHPSRIGERLHYRDGMVTDLQGNPIAQAPKPPNPRRNVNRKL